MAKSTKSAAAKDAAAKTKADAEKQAAEEKAKEEAAKLKAEEEAKAKAEEEDQASDEEEEEEEDDGPSERPDPETDPTVVGNAFLPPQKIVETETALLDWLPEGVTLVDTGCYATMLEFSAGFLKTLTADDLWLIIETTMNFVSLRIANDHPEWTNAPLCICLGRNPWTIYRNEGFLSRAVRTNRLASMDMAPPNRPVRSQPSLENNILIC